MEIIVLGIIGTIVFFAILYFVVKAAVRNAIAESQGAANDGKPFADGAISQTKCPACGGMHDVDYPKCPHCGHGG